MKIFKYPHLVLIEILHSMNYSEIFMMSFISKNMKKLIKSYQIARFEKIDSIRYECNPRGQPLVYIYYKSSSEKIVKIDKLDKNINDYFQLNISGKMIDFR
ncbi:Protein CBG22125 [Caenorhabditis briggsae]|uniref:Protein CBG22125 n=1 Tax=Caenorhabditis briggsae TaxID=6238 RepID=A8Y1K8_CAEBR|nr:Protein CBG22125 [Caenorhabditis briggsae]CAP38778.2 Protein CBG22125 [Caenorhabditis briggsae]